MDYEIVMGLEVHVELSTKTKIFCGCSTEFGGEPNSHTCPVCMGMPGSLPVLNKGVVDRAIKTGLAFHCDLQYSNMFDRKNYFYPDLPKDYQISQLYHPVCLNGYIEIENPAPGQDLDEYGMIRDKGAYAADGTGNSEIKSKKLTPAPAGVKRIRLHEIHMEEDAGKLVHDAAATLVDYNRCGVPLLEIVSEPDFRSADEVVEYLEKIREMLVYMDVSDCKMEEGSMRADVNLSVRPAGSDKFGTRTEMKNINSLKSIKNAIEFEARRQIDILRSGGTVSQETRRWDEEKSETYAMRSKENAQDYRYFPDPDLVPIRITDKWVEEMKAQMPELPQEKRRRYVEDLGLSAETARTITSEKALADLFDKSCEICGFVRETANTITGDLIGIVKEAGGELEDVSIDPAKFAKIIELVSEEKINRNVGRDLVKELYIHDIDPEEYVIKNGLMIENDLSVITSVIDDVFAEFPQSVADYKSGKKKAFGFMVGQVMRKLAGKGSPRAVNGLLKEKLDGTAYDPEKAAEEEKKKKQEKAEAAAKPKEKNVSRETYQPQLTAAEKALKRAGDETESEETENSRIAFAPNRYRTHTCGELREKNIGEHVRVSGWLQTVRDHGGIVFIDLRDFYGVTQVLVTEEMIKGIPKETVIMVEGDVIKRDESTINPNIATGLVEVKAEKIEVLGPCKPSLPFEVERSKETREDVRLRYRYLDLRNSAVRDNMIFRSKINQYLRRKMEDLGFIEIQTPILAASSPEGARDYLVPSRKHKGKFYALPQAPQQFKQLLMASGFDRYFQIAPCFRDEDARLDRSPGEFYQLDFEMAFATQEDVFAVAEKVMYDTFTHFSDLPVSKPPFRRITYKDAMLKYGTDKPDLRNPLIIIDLSDFFAKVDFAPFRGNIVRAIRVPGAIKQSKSWFKSMEKFALGIGMKGLGYISVKDDMTYKGPIDKFMTDEQKKEIAELASLEPGDVLYFISDEPGLVEKYAGQIRTEVAERLNMIDKDRFEFCYIVDFPMYEINEETGKLDFTHNPFSMPQGEMDALMNKDPLDILAYQYDIVCNGYELSSGAVRNHRPDIMVKAFEIAGYDEEVVKQKFGALYNAFQYGAPPHAGMAPGIDRIVMLLTGEENIREVITFPLNSNAEDLMFGSPGEVTEQQLREVHIKIR
ncbi:MAG: aspartate--tRNA ligase [Anaerovoracaceae bacterium]|jgi:aspartyl-tRNA synthetase